MKRNSKYSYVLAAITTIVANQWIWLGPAVKADEPEYVADRFIVVLTPQARAGIEVGVTESFRKSQDFARAMR
jgi:hypothetical protein